MHRQPHCSLRLLVAFLLIFGLCACGATRWVDPEPEAGSARDAARASAKRASGSGYASFVFQNGGVYTVTAARRFAEAVAVRGDRIVYVGSTLGARELVGPETQVIDLAGRMLLPGFIEAHIHPIAGAFMARGADLQTDDLDELLARVVAEAAAHPNAPIVRGYGWRYNVFPDSGPNKEALDAIVSDRPVFLFAIDGHGAWVNSKALELAEIGVETPDPQPPFSVYQRDWYGGPTGYLVEVPAILEVLSVVAPVDKAYVREGFEEWAPRFSAAGITSVFDAGIQGLPVEEGYALYTELEAEGRLPFRVVGSYYWNDPEVDPLPPLRALRERFHTELVDPRVLKINADGGEMQHTAYLLQPYADEPRKRGELIIPSDMIREVVVRADADGIDFHCHCYGDAATRTLLDALEAAVEVNPMRHRRHTLAHLAVVDPWDVPRFAVLGAIAQFSTHWAALDPAVDEVARRRFGSARTNHMFAPRPLIDAGTRISLGTDWPASGYYSTYKPLDSIQIAVTRQQIGKPDQAVLGGRGQRLSLDEALLANTLGAAYQLRLEEQVGSIEVGKRADLIVLDRNLFETPEHEIHRARVLLTLMNGRITHRDAGP
jgi:hypothetical protein